MAPRTVPTIFRREFPAVIIEMTINALSMGKLEGFSKGDRPRCFVTMLTLDPSVGPDQLERCQVVVKFLGLRSLPSVRRVTRLAGSVSKLLIVRSAVARRAIAEALCAFDQYFRLRRINSFGMAFAALHARVLACQWKLRFRVVKHGSRCPSNCGMTRLALFPNGTTMTVLVARDAGFIQSEIGDALSAR